MTYRRNRGEASFRATRSAMTTEQYADGIEFCEVRKHRISRHFVVLRWEKSHVRHRRPLSSVCPSVPVGTDSVTGSQDAQHNTRTLKPSGLLQPALVWAHKKTRRAYFQRRLGNTPLKSTGETRCRSMFAAPRACLCVCVVWVWLRGAWGS